MKKITIEFLNKYLKKNKKDLFDFLICFVYKLLSLNGYWNQFMPGENLIKMAK
jgi:hypothetical protein